MNHNAHQLPQNMASARDMIDHALAIAMHFMQTTVTATFGSVPGPLAFAQDMFLNVLLNADWQAIVHLHKQYVNKNVCQPNMTHYKYD